jgi:hypothetical protein
VGEAANTRGGTRSVRRTGASFALTGLLVVALVAAVMPSASSAPVVTPVSDPAPEAALLAPAAVSFTDVPAGAYYANAVAWLVDKGITAGVSQNPPRYGPDGQVTRGQMAAFLWRMMDRPSIFSSCGFGDVNPTAYYAEGTCWLRNTRDITVGFGGDLTVFAPDVAVNRSQMALFLWRLADRPPAPAVCGLRDVPVGASYGVAACWLKAVGITTGYGGDTSLFAPGIIVTRAQMAAFLERMASTPEAWRILTPSTVRFSCEVLDPRSCLLPYPSDHFTRADATTATGRRLALARATMPKNRSNVRIDPSEQNRNDGFSPGSALMFHAPTADLEASGAAPITDMGASLDPDTAVVIINTLTGERHPHWVELDAQAANADDKVTFIRPAVNFDEGVRYVVGIRNLVDGDGIRLGSSQAFAALRDNTDLPSAAVQARRAGMERVFDDLEAAGVTRDDLYLAWEFTVASQRNLSERLLHLRNDSFDNILKERAPTVSILATKDAGGSPATLRKIAGSIKVPNYLTGNGSAGQRFNWNAATGLPTRNPTRPTLDVPFWCTRPLDASGDTPTRMVLVGHGLLQSGESDLYTSSSFDWAARDGNLTLCAVDLWGLATSDIGPVATILGDLSGFASLPDRGQQALLNFLWLGRALKHAEGLGTKPAFQDAQGRSILDTSQLYYNGNSQGGIMGGALMAVAQDFDRALLGVPAINYSTLLDRSVLATIFGQVSAFAYPSPMDRTISLGLTQLLWDRSEGNGYARHIISDPYPNTPPKDIFVFMAYADEAVANVATEVMARTMGIGVRAPVIASSRLEGNHPDVEPLWGINRITSFPHAGSAMLLWDFGDPPPPVTNTPPASPSFGIGGTRYPDPHAAGGKLSVLRNLIFDYFQPGGVLNDPCGGLPCAGLPDR